MNPRTVSRYSMFRVLAASTLVMVLGAALGAPPAASAASGPYLVKDILEGGSSWPIDLTDLNGTLIFSAQGGGRGRELWCSDGTNAGTWRVKDIRPGGSGSRVAGITAIGDLVYFSADDGVHGNELWASDGTASGTRMVADINPGWAHSQPSGFTEFNGAVYFSVNNAPDASPNSEIWRTDGTAAGTNRVKTFRRGLYFAPHERFVAFAGKLFFVMTEDTHATTTTLWRTDGTTAGTIPFRDTDGLTVAGRIPDDVGIGQWPLWSLTAVGPRLFFGRYANYEYELWRSNGTAATTRKISAEFQAYRITAVGATAFITGGDTGGGVWRSDGTATSTTLLKTVSGYDVPMPGNFLVASLGTLFMFDAWDAEYGPRLWTSDGTAQGTQPLDALIGGEGSAVVGSALYFIGNALETGSTDPSTQSCGFQCGSLWRSDGSPTGTHSLSAAQASMNSLTAVGDSVYWVSNRGHNGYELRRYVP